MSDTKWCLTLVACIAVGILADDPETYGSIPELEVAESSIHRTRSLPRYDDEDASNRNWTTISEMLDIYSSKNLAMNWKAGKFPVTSECDRDVTRYIEGLKNHEIWALKGNFKKKKNI